MKFLVHKTGEHPLRDAYAEHIVEELVRQEHQQVTNAAEINFVLNLTSVAAPGIFRRNSRAIFVVSLVVAEKPYANLRAICYQTLVRTLANLLICIVPENSGKPVGSTLPPAQVYFTTPEAGFYQLQFEQKRIYQRMLPIVGARFAIENSFTVDLPRRCWKNTPVVEQIRRYGRELDALGVLPAPFPLRQFLSPEDLEHLYHLFQVKGLSYGNLSARESIPELGETTFWMTARGINKARIGAIGREVLLVKGVDEERGAVLVSVPPDYDPRARVSVDAVEHALIYREFPRVGAIVHVHAWMNGVQSTRQNHPCGTVELAQEVVALLRRTPEPHRTVVGLKNHGLTITGPNLEEIFRRIRGQLIREVPMVA